MVKMDRRRFLTAVAAAGIPFGARALPKDEPPAYENLLILVELKGGNDALNTVVPYADPAYYDLRPRLAVSRDTVLQLDAKAGLHPALQALFPLWQQGELAIVQGVGYPNANLSHFRSIEIWDTASDAGEYLHEGWLARAFAEVPPPRSYAADGIVIGNEIGPFAGARTRALALRNPAQFVRQAALAQPAGEARNEALEHILRLEREIAHAAVALSQEVALTVDFPSTPFGNAVRAAAQVLARGAAVPALKLSLNGFDTHSGQSATHSRLLGDLAQGLLALKAVLEELGRWRSTLVMTYAEFGRRPRENLSAGTDHGTAGSHFLLGGRIRGGLYGAEPSLNRLDGNGNLPFAVDFRELYATVLEKWWRVPATPVLRQRYAPLEIIRA